MTGVSGDVPPGRMLDPFCFFVGEASAIAGMGGEEAPQDSRYCFHTQYLELLPGRTMYHCRFFGARASFGELQLRVHGFYPGFDAQLVASTVTYLEGLDQDLLSLDIGFMALEGIQYALCGYVSDHTDMEVTAMDVHVEELDGDKHRSGNAQPTSLIGAMGRYDIMPKLLAGNNPSAVHPTSQPFTFDQIADPAYRALWPAISERDDDGRGRWGQVVVLQALAQAGLLQTGAHLLLAGDNVADIGEELTARGCVLRLLPDLLAYHEDLAGDEPPSHDIVVALAPVEDYETAVGRALDLLARSGMALLMLDVDPERATFDQWSNRIRRIGLKLLGRGHELVQINLASQENWWPALGEHGLFLLMLRK